MINDVEKSQSGEEVRLHDEETNKSATNIKVAVTKNYHKDEPHHSLKVNNSTNNIQKISVDQDRESSLRSNDRCLSKYQKRKSHISNKSLNKSLRQSRKSDIPCPYLIKRGWCIKSNRCDYSHQNIRRQASETPKSKVPCPFLKTRGYCFKDSRCDFLHPIKRQRSTQQTTMSPQTPTYPRVPLFQTDTRRDTRLSFLFHPHWPIPPPFPPPLMNALT